jgi:hypothetical protein
VRKGEVLGWRRTRRDVDLMVERRMRDGEMFMEMFTKREWLSRRAVKRES